LLEELYRCGALENEVIGMVSQNKVLPGLIAVEKHGVLDLLDGGLEDHIKKVPSSVSKMLS
jgi:hypothetical protein